MACEDLEEASGDAGAGSGSAEGGDRDGLGQ